MGKFTKAKFKSKNSESLQIEAGNANLNKGINDYEDIEKFLKDKTDDEINSIMLRAVMINATRLYNFSEEEEIDKRNNRKVYLKRFYCIFIILLFLFIAGIVFDSLFNSFNLSTEIIVGVLATIFSSIASIVIILVKYISNPKHLETFEIISKEILDYIKNKKV